MWPRMLLELLPHVSRLVPMADRFLSSRSASDKAQEAALASLRESLQGDLAHVAETHAGIQRTLQEQNAQVTEIAVEVTRCRMGVASIETQTAKLEISVARLEKSLRTARILLIALLVMVLAVLGLVVLWRK